MDIPLSGPDQTHFLVVTEYTRRLRQWLWPPFVIALALLLTLLWSGTLVWLICCGIFRPLLSALF
jgi:hypothetical protein